MTVATTNPRHPQAKFKMAAKKRMLEMGLSVTQLAKDLNMSRQAVSQAINAGTHAPTRERIATRLSIKIS